MLIYFNGTDCWAMKCLSLLGFHLSGLQFVHLIADSGLWPVVCTWQLCKGSVKKKKEKIIFKCASLLRQLAGHTPPPKRGAVEIIVIQIYHLAECERLQDAVARWNMQLLFFVSSQTIGQLSQKFGLLVMLPPPPPLTISPFPLYPTYLAQG